MIEISIICQGFIPDDNKLDGPNDRSCVSNSSHKRRVKNASQKAKMYST